MKKFIYCITSLMLSAVTLIAQQNSASTGSIETVTIGNQIWSSKNLKEGVFKNGDKIMLAQSEEDWEKATRSKTPAYCYYSYQENIDNLEKTKKSIIENANNIRANYSFKFSKEGELESIMKQYELEKSKASISKNSKKELANVDLLYKGKIDELNKIRAEEEKMSLDANESEYRKAMETADSFNEDIEKFKLLEVELNQGEKYGYMYNYWALLDPRGLNIPDGWKVPSLDEWLLLKKNVEKLYGPEIGLALRSTNEWFENKKSGREYICNGNNITKFNGLPGGWRNQFTKKFENVHDFAYWWSSTPIGSNWSANAFGLDCANKSLYQDTNSFNGGLYIRVIKSDEKKKK